MMINATLCGLSDRSGPNRWAFGLIVLLSVVVTRPVMAAENWTVCPSPPADDETRQELAGAWFAKAQEFVEREAYGEAVRAFECSFSIMEHPDTAFNAARSARLAGDDEAALRYAKRYLEMRPDGEVAGEAAEIVNDLEGAQTGVATDDVGQKPRGDTAEGDRAGGDGGESSAERVAGSEDDTTEMVEKTEEPPGEASSDAPAASSATDRGNPALAMTGYVTLGVGGVGIVVGAVLQGLAAKAWADGKDTTSYRDFKAYKNKMASLQTGALVGLIAGGVIAGAGATMLILERRNRKKQVTVGVLPTALVIYGRF